MIYGALGAMFGVVVCLLGFIVVQHAKHNQLLDQMGARWFEKEQAWAIERQQLLDRIQAPSFDHLKQAEIRIIKAQSGEKEPPKLEQL